MEADQLIGLQGDCRISPAFVINEFNFRRFRRKHFDHCPDLTTYEAMLG